MINNEKNRSFDYLNKMLDEGKVSISAEEFRILAKHYQEQADFLEELIESGNNGFGINSNELHYEEARNRMFANHYYKAMNKILDDKWSFNCEKEKTSYEFYD